ncbi:MAG: hypothetical protein ABTR07_14730 [Candidatus Competibacter denitrificans]
MANMDLSLGWRRGYAPTAGMTTTFDSTLDMQLSSGFANASSLYVNNPTLAVAGPGLSLNAIEFNKGTSIQRVVSRSSALYPSTPSAWHIVLIVRPDQLAEMVIFAWVPSQNMAAISATFRLCLIQNGWGAGSGWFFQFQRLDIAGTAVFNMLSPQEIPITAGRWYFIVISLPYTQNDYTVFMSVNEYAHYWNGWGTELFSYGGAPVTTYSYYKSIADDDQLDGISVALEGARRFVGRIAYFGYTFNPISLTDSASRAFTDEMRNRFYWTNATLSSSLERPRSLTRMAVRPVLRYPSLRMRLRF